MSLIRCPECNRENVSDMAKACPGCGYNIKEHFERIKQDDIESIYEAIEKKEIEERAKAIEKRREERANSVPFPRPEPVIFLVLFLFILSLNMAISYFSKPNSGDLEYDVEISNETTKYDGVIGVFCSILTGTSLIAHAYAYIDAVKDAKKDLKKYQREFVLKDEYNGRICPRCQSRIFSKEERTSLLTGEHKYVIRRCAKCKYKWRTKW